MIATALALMLLAYLADYGAFRLTHTEVWQADQRRHVIFPAHAKALYYFFRPLAYLDGTVTGIGFHIGPHR